MGWKIMYFDDLLSLLYPRVCINCGNSLFKGEEVICTFCRFKLPRTNYHLLRDNPVHRAFWGRADTEAATAFLYFSKGGMVQRLLHHLKYRGRKDAGIYLGRLFAYELQRSRLYEKLDTLVPVPLHPRKQRLRGYNQSEQIAAGIGKVLKIELMKEVLIRKEFTETQTRKSRYQRWLNVGEMFDVKKPELLEGRHIMLVDDVITTGATLEACIQALSKIRDVTIYIGTIAYVSD
ncbi:MAG: phosphoribosyltransferase family protein [Bacteroidota bacterium]|nr:phosphoribosyltransferase family protein [Bacteroidota bacterium]